MARYFEDIAVGDSRAYGSYHITREEALDFATRYDPQPFHLDDAAAALNPVFGRLSCSGWMTAAVGMRMMVDVDAASGGYALGGAGIEDLTWLKPVYPGDTLRCESEVIEKRESRSKPNIGLIKSRTTLFNQHDEPVMRQTATTVHPRRARD